MNSTQLKVLKYLAKHDDGEYHDVRNAFGKNALPSNEYLETILDELKDYIEQESVYETRGIIFLDTNPSIEPKVENSLKSKIGQKGREFLIEFKSKNQNLFIAIGGLVIGLISLILAIF